MLKKVIIVSLLIFIFSSPVLAIDIGKKYHITGCENGQLMVPVVNMWSKPGGIAAGARVVGKLSGDGRADQGLQCQGAVVEILDIQGHFIQIQSVVNGNVGWVTKPFIGRRSK